MTAFSTTSTKMTLWVQPTPHYTAPAAVISTPFSPNWSSTVPEPQHAGHLPEPLQTEHGASLAAPFAETDGTRPRPWHAAHRPSPHAGLQQTPPHQPHLGPSSGGAAGCLRGLGLRPGGNRTVRMGSWKKVD